MTERLTIGEGERPLPLVDDESRPFWVAGRDGMLSFVSCNACGALLHPPAPVCRYCKSGDLGRRSIAGTGVVVGYSVNHQQWDPKFPVPYAVATVAMDEDSRVRLTTNLVDVDLEDLRVGMRGRSPIRPPRGRLDPLLRSERRA